MFTGLIDAVGAVKETRRTDEGLTLKIAAPYKRLVKGESISVDGACLTVERTGAGWFSVHVVATSLARTSFASYGAKRRINLERALRVGDRLGGHLVQGHVDGVGEVVRVWQEQDARRVDLRVPAEVAAVSIPLGSIAVDGVSLTVEARPDPVIVRVSLIPYTLQHTTLGERQVGDQVHLEGDLIGKFVAALVERRERAK